MRIQVVARHKQGCDWFRCVLPAIYLQKDIEWCKNNSIEMLWIAHDELKIDCDILIYNKLIATTIERLKHLKKNGMKIVVDVDDHWILPPGHAHYQQWMTCTEPGQTKSNSELTEEHMRLADVVTCTSMRLQEVIRKFNKNTVVIPNALPFGHGLYQQGIREPNDKMVFLYAGGVSHLPDVELLKGKFQRIGTDPYLVQRAEFVLAGYEKEKQKLYKTKQDYEQRNSNFTTKDIHGLYDDMVSIFKQTNSYKVINSEPVNKYISCYDQADVVLAPLVENTWNSFKSNLKVLEASSRELPIICSAVAPYSDLRPCEGIMFVEKSSDWIDYIRKCVKEPQWTKDMGLQLASWIREEYNLVRWNLVRQQLYSTL